MAESCSSLIHDGGKMTVGGIFLEQIIGFCKRTAEFHTRSGIGSRAVDKTMEESAQFAVAFINILRGIDVGKFEKKIIHILVANLRYRKDSTFFRYIKIRK